MAKKRVAASPRKPMIFQTPPTRTIAQTLKSTPRQINPTAAYRTFR